MSALLQTLYATGDRVVQVLTGNAPIELGITPAQTHDGSDVTHELAEDFPPCNLVWGVTYAFDLLTAPTITVDFVRVKIRAKVVGPSGSVRPMISGAARGTRQTLTLVYQDFQFDFTVDPATGLPWTPASINAQVGWGFICDQIVDAVSARTAVVSELAVEVWGMAGRPVAGAVGSSLEDKVDGGALQAAVGAALVGTVEQGD